MGSFVEAMILVLSTYAGWHEAAYIVAEVKNNRRNIPLALIIGTLGVMAIYLLVNLACITGLGLEAARSATLPADVASLPWPHFGPQAISLLLVLSPLRPINALTLPTPPFY